MRSKEDDRLRHKLENKLSNQGLRAPCRLSVEVYQKTATLTGMVQYEYQKRSAIQAARTLDGVSSVIDRIKIEAPVHRWDDDPQAAAHHAPRDAIDPVPGPTDVPEELP
jgi:hypothetical protein